MIRLLHALFFIALAVWLGSTIARMIVGYDLFVAGTAQLKHWYPQQQQTQTIWLFTLLGGLTNWSFGVFALGGLGVLLWQRKQWRTNGWMLMTVICIALLLPAQIWLMLGDYELWHRFNPTTGLPNLPANQIASIFVERITDIRFSIVNGLSILMGITITGILAMRPLITAKPQESEPLITSIRN